MPYTLFFWNQPAGFSLLPANIAQELQHGNDVEGLIDLPVHEILTRLKAEFPSAIEKAGSLAGKTEGGSFEATWSWQFLRIDGHALTDEIRERLCGILQEFGALAYDPQLNLRYQGDER